jgi:hypothetical protein
MDGGRREEKIMFDLAISHSLTFLFNISIM